MPSDTRAARLRAGRDEPRLVVERRERTRELRDLPGLPAAKTEHGTRHFAFQRPFLPGGYGLGGREYTEENGDAGDRRTSTRSCSTSCSPRWPATRPRSTATSSRARSTYAAAAHEGQQRQSGSDFIEHPVGAATHLRRAAARRADDRRGAPPRRRRGHGDRHRGRARGVRRRDRASSSRASRS